MPTPDLAAERLRSLQHIVVVMMENRSFDHMLGYLSLEGMQQVDGLTDFQSDWANFALTAKRAGLEP